MQYNFVKILIKSTLFFILIEEHTTPTRISHHMDGCVRWNSYNFALVRMVLGEVEE